MVNKKATLLDQNHFVIHHLLVIFVILVGQLKQISRAIGNELDDQAILIDSLSAEVDSAHGRMNATLAKIQRVTR